MRKMLLGVAAAAMTLTGFAASAQPYGYYPRGGYDSDRDGRPDRREWNRDRDRDGRPDQYDRYDNRRGYSYDSDRDGRPDRREWNRDRDRDGRPDQYDRYDNRRGYSYQGQRWRQGQVYPYYRNRGY